jgi:hypothetical protein
MAFHCLADEYAGGNVALPDHFLGLERLDAALKISLALK